MGAGEEVAHDVASAGPLERLAALLDGPAAGRPGEVPPLAHWLYFLPAALQSALGEDGHPTRTGLLAATAPLLRRMWAGGRVEWRGPIPVGARLTRRTALVALTDKAGGAGPLSFATLRHNVFAEGVAALVEHQDLVFRGPPSPAAGPERGPPSAAIKLSPARGSRTLMLDPTALFRFSALTFNAHRIHYDRPYATEAEGYPGLVVQGPLLAMLLVDFALRSEPGARPARFAFRARTPLFEGEAITLNLAEVGEGCQLWAAGADSRVGMTAELAFS